MKDAVKKQALATVFGVTKSDGVITAPNVPGLRQKVTCTKCTLETVKGLPVQFEQYMTDEQKTEFRALIGYKARKKVSQVPQDVVTNEA